MNYREKAPNITTTGAGKNYDGHRIFHTIRSGRIEYICNDGETRYATTDEVSRFKKDLAIAASENPKVKAYLERFPGLKTFEPLTEGIETNSEEAELKKAV